MEQWHISGNAFNMRARTMTHTMPAKYSKFALRLLKETSNPYGNFLTNFVNVMKFNDECDVSFSSDSAGTLPLSKLKPPACVIGITAVQLRVHLE